MSFTKLKDFDRGALQNGLLLAFWFISLLTYVRCENQLVPIYCMVGYAGIQDFFRVIKENLLPKIKESNKFLKIVKGITKGIGITGLSLGLLTVLKMYYIPLLNIVQEDEEASCYKFSKGAIDYLKENNITEGVFNTYNTGGYLIFEDYPTFLDPRADPFVIETSTKDIFRDVDNINNVLDREQAWLDLAKKYDIEYFVFMPETGSKADVYLFLNSEKFELVYEDNIGYIDYENMLKQTEQKEDIPTIGDSGYLKKGYVFKLKDE